MEFQFAKALGRLGTESAFEVLARARALEAQGRNIVHLEIGEPDFDTPKNVIDAGVKALQSGWTHYGPAQGLPQLREAIAQEIGRTRGFTPSLDEILVCPGAKPIMFYLLLVLCEEGDEVVYPNPGFPIYESMINWVGAKPVPCPILEKNDFGFDLDAFRRLITPKTKLVILNTPSNPTGGVLAPELLEGIARIARDHKFVVLSDEIYGRIIYDGSLASITKFDGMRERTVILDGFSKAYAMTGWRLGYGVGPKEIIQRMTKMQINSASCTASFTQLAGVEALTGPQDAVTHMVDVFRKRRDRIVSGLNAIPGISCRTPKGAFYVFPNITGTGMTSRQFADALLNDFGVAALAGTAFGAFGEGHLRFSYATSFEAIDEGLARVRKCAEAVLAK
ncbi:MAG TPA: pyridoxal phosphate-dependent aminotransferase [Planctomycetota bacterium]|nr:pyridoxal phosphate-dependent aminotransferase [Planctomycetota bacterium]